MVETKQQPVVLNDAEPETAGTGDEPTCEALLEALPDAIIVLDDKAIIRAANRRVEHLFGYDDQALVGEAVEVLLSPRAAGAYSKLRRSFCAHPRLSQPLGGVLTGRRSDGFEFGADVAFTGIDVAGRLWAVVAVREIAPRGRGRGPLRAPGFREDRSLLSLLAEAQEGERRRIADDIHEDSIQVLSVVAMRLDQLRRRIDSPDLVGVVDRLEQDVNLATRRLRRLMFELRPRTLDVEGLVATLRAYLAEIAEEAGIAYDVVDGNLVAEPAPETRTVLFRIAQEAVTNVRKHARATRVTAVVESVDDGFLTTITDDGIGFRPSGAVTRPTHAGLASMRERAEMAGGRLQLESEPGKGTTVRFWLPEVVR